MHADLLLFLCGSQPAGDGDLEADQYLPDIRRSLVGAGLLAMAAWMPTNLSQMYSISVGARL
jgi:hypothetical protein